MRFLIRIAASSTFDAAFDTHQAALGAYQVELKKTRQESTND
jgi:hypothetical protein